MDAVTETNASTPIRDPKIIDPNDSLPSFTLGITPKALHSTVLFLIAEQVLSREMAWLCCYVPLWLLGLIPYLFPAVDLVVR